MEFDEKRNEKQKKQHYTHSQKYKDNKTLVSLVHSHKPVKSLGYLKDVDEQAF